MTLQIALDADNNKIWFGINGTFVTGGDPVAGIYAAYTNAIIVLFPSIGDGSSGGDYKATFNFGQQAFVYTPPTGFKSLNAAKPASAEQQKGSEYFNTIVWSGTQYPTSNHWRRFSARSIWTKPRSTSQ